MSADPTAALPASPDELRTLQLERLRQTLRHAYAERRRTTGEVWDAAGVHPDDVRELADLGRFPLTSKEDLRAQYPFGMFAVPRDQVVRVHASSGTTGRPTVVGYTRDGHRHLGRADGALDLGRRWAAGRPRARGVRLRVVHRRARRPLRGRATRLHGGAGVRRHDRAPGAADPRLRAARDHGDAVVLPRDRRRDGAAGPRPGRDPLCRSASSAPSRGRSRCGPRSSGGARWTPSTSTGCRR